MVGVFKRSLSFPTKINPNRPSKPPQISHHIRSISLPCRSHPSISQLKDQLTDLKSTWAPLNTTTSSNWLICDGLSRLREIHNSLDDILQLSQTQDFLKNQKGWVEKLLDDFLKFVDVYGIFQTLLLSFKEEQFAAQVAVRKKDYCNLALYVKSRRKLSKEIGKLLSTVKCVEKRTVLGPTIGEAELAGVMSDVVEATVIVSMAVFGGISSSFGARKNNWIGFNCKKIDEFGGILELKQVGEESLLGVKKLADGEMKTLLLKRMREMESCIGSIESGTEQVFRSLISSRVSLLNTLTQI